MKKRKVDISLTEAKTSEEAMTYLFIGIKYFFAKHTKKALIFSLAILFCVAYVLNDYLTTDKIKIKEMKPIGANFSIMPQAIAVEEVDQIVIDGKSYGRYDVNYQVWKKHGQDVLIIYNKISKKGWEVDFPALSKK